MLAANFLIAPLLNIASRLLPAKTKQPAASISFSIIIPAYNEEKNIASKIETVACALKRVTAEVEIIIGSDGSTDRTVEIASTLLNEMKDPRWRLVEFPNEGKCKTINKLVALVQGEIIISTDADIPLPENSLELVVRAFQANTRLGCLSCIPCFKGLDIGSQKSYWSIEDRIRSGESDLGKLIVVTGMLYAYRKDLFRDIPDGVMADDLWIPLNVLLKKYECRNSAELLIPYEKTDEEVEILRRKRVIVGGMDVVRRLLPEILNSPGLLILVFFHKVNRWALPFWFMLLLVALVGLWPWIMVFYMVSALLAFAVLGAERFNRLAYAGISPILSFVEVLRSRDFAKWEHTRKH